MSRRSTRPSRIASRQPITARMVSGLSHKASSTVLRPASIRLAISISPSRDRSSIVPISRRYMRTGSSVRPSSSSGPCGVSSPSASAAAGSLSPAGSTSAGSPSLSPPASSRSTMMPCASRSWITSSVCSGGKSAGSAEFSWSKVTEPRSLACTTSRRSCGLFCRIASSPSPTCAFAVDLARSADVGFLIGWRIAIALSSLTIRWSLGRCGTADARIQQRPQGSGPSASSASASSPPSRFSSRSSR